MGPREENDVDLTDPEKVSPGDVLKLLAALTDRVVGVELRLTEAENENHALRRQVASLTDWRRHHIPQCKQLAETQEKILRGLNGFGDSWIKAVRYWGYDQGDIRRIVTQLQDLLDAEREAGGDGDGDDAPPPTPLRG